MRIVIALAEKALHKRGERGSAEDEARCVSAAASQLAKVADGNDIVIVQERDEFDAPAGDGCRFERELRHCLTNARPCATLRAMVEVDTADPALARSEQATGGFITGEHVLVVTRGKPCSPAHDGIGYRHAAPNPRPKRLLQARLLHRLVEQGAVVMCRGGGTPVVAAPGGGVSGVRGFIDPYDCAALIAETIDADLFVIAIEMAGVILDWGTANSKLLRHGHPSALREFASCAGAMAPKLQAASRFAERTGRRAVIGALAEVERLVEGTAGTTISCQRVDPRSVSCGSVAC